MCMGMPDTCKTPMGPVVTPIPYVNIAENMMAMGNTVCTSVKLQGFPGATVSTEISLSMGDEPGVEGGVVSNTFMSACKFKLGSSSVKFGGQQAVYLGSMIGHNNASNPNAPAGMQIAPSSETVQVAP